MDNQYLTKLLEFAEKEKEALASSSSSSASSSSSSPSSPSSSPSSSSFPVLDIDVVAPPPHQQKYFSPLYHPENHHYVYRNPNGLCLIGLADKHPLIQRLKQGEVVTDISFFGNLENQKVKEETSLCVIKCNSVGGEGEAGEYTVLSCVPGSVIEVNDKFLGGDYEKITQLMKEKSGTEGHFAIIQPWIPYPSSLSRKRRRQQRDETNNKNEEKNEENNDGDNNNDNNNNNGESDEKETIKIKSEKAFFAKFLNFEEYLSSSSSSS